MANYKSQYTGEQIDEAIGKVLNAQNIYNYDGTVIIESSQESVLGLRRFKDTLEFPNEEFEYPVSFTFNGVELGLGYEVLCVAIKSTLIQRPIPEENYFIIAYVLAEEVYGGGNMVSQNYDGTWEYNSLKTINVLECEDATAKAWLLANTDKVNVLGLRKFKEEIEAPITDTVYSTTNNVDELISIFDTYGFNITPISESIEVEGGVNVVTLNGMSCCVPLEYNGDIILGVVLKASLSLADGTQDDDFYIMNTFDDVISNELYSQFDVISTANSLVDEWLIANTEGVSV